VQKAYAAFAVPDNSFLGMQAVLRCFHPQNIPLLHQRTVMF